MKTFRFSFNDFYSCRLYSFLLILSSSFGGLLLLVEPSQKKQRPGDKTFIIFYFYLSANFAVISYIFAYYCSTTRLVFFYGRFSFSHIFQFLQYRRSGVRVSLSEFYGHQTFLLFFSVLLVVKKTNVNENEKKFCAADNFEISAKKEH